MNCFVARIRALRCIRKKASENVEKRHGLGFSRTQVFRSCVRRIRVTESHAFEETTCARMWAVPEGGQHNQWGVAFALNCRLMMRFSARTRVFAAD